MTRAIIGDAIYPLAPRAPWRDAWNTLRVPQSLVYFCDRCGDIWARIDEGTPEWHFVLRRCEAHGEGYLGEICERGLAASFPHELLVREFLCASGNPTMYFCNGGL